VVWAIPRDHSEPGVFGNGVSTASGTMVLRLNATENTKIRNTINLIHEGRYTSEVPVELVEDDTGWSPYLSLEDAKKLDAVRLALRRGEIAEAAEHSRVFELTPISK
jgi:hypothetical protein